MKRLIENKIKEWLKNSKNALLINGPRFIGKTYTIKKVLAESDTHFLEVNFRIQKEFINLLDKASDTEEILDILRFSSNEILIPHKSVIFLDEVQLYPDIITKIKFLVDEGSFKYILSGSLLGVELKNIRSIPVGYMEEIKMYPMNFYEYALALGVQENVLKHIEESFKSLTPVDSLIHERMLKLINSYIITGGMPKVIDTFIKTKNLNQVNLEQQSIVNQYKNDFTKYENDDKKLKIINIYDNMASQLNKENLKFIFTYLDKELKFDRYENSFLRLKDAGVAYPCYIAKECKTPLLMSKEKNTFRLFFNDVGLLNSYFPYNVKLDLLNDGESLKINKGAIYENFVMEELKANNLEPYYYKDKNIGEIDFLVEVDNELIALEIKSGKDYKKHKALNNLIKKYKDNIDKSIVFSLSNVEVDNENNILYLPIYMISLLKREEPHDYIVNMDFLNDLK